jgi:hypothetical protein
MFETTGTLGSANRAAASAGSRPRRAGFNSGEWKGADTGSGRAR